MLCSNAHKDNIDWDTTEKRKNYRLCAVLHINQNKTTQIPQQHRRGAMGEGEPGRGVVEFGGIPGRRRKTHFPHERVEGEYVGWRAGE